jgi:hypothetical protein
MKYTKPEVGMSIAAIDAVHDPMNKGIPQYLEGPAPWQELGSINAYAADE